MSLGVSEFLTDLNEFSWVNLSCASFETTLDQILGSSNELEVGWKGSGSQASF